MQPEKIAPGLYWLPTNVSNAYTLGEPGGPWVLVDTTTPGHFESIRGACEDIYGPGARPECIVLTHGHLDHCGSAVALATYWDVPVYAHPMEHPYLNGRAKYPPADPTVLGFLAFAFRLLAKFAEAGIDLGDWLRPLPEDGSVPVAPEWRWHATPGHTPGHVSLFRERDRALVAGDAVLTTDLDKMTDAVGRKQELARPPSPVTYDWTAVRKSLLHLATLRPSLVASGHGDPMSTPEMADDFSHFAEMVIFPLHGRYVAEPAVADENGFVLVPPPASDPYKTAAVGLGAAALLGAGVYLLLSRRGGKAGGNGSVSPVAVSTVADAQTWEVSEPES